MKYYIISNMYSATKTKTANTTEDDYIMIRSMTGYGRGEYEEKGKKFTVEIRSVNHRYNELSIKLPRSMNYLEDKIRKSVSKEIFRGKTDLYVNYESHAGEDVLININYALADSYVEKLKSIEERYGCAGRDNLSLIARFPDIISVEKADDDENVIWSYLETALNSALIQFIEMRSKEGEALKDDILSKSSLLKTLVLKITEKAPLVSENYRQKLTARLSELLSGVNIDEQRIITEVMIFADKSCIDEELTRLNSHINQLDGILLSGGLVGRKLDFLIQEMNREANTIASKSNEIEITKAAIELKSEIEKIREQVQNIE